MIYTGPTNWVNDQEPALNAKNMNAISAALQQSGFDIESLKTAVGSPLTASTAATMTDKQKVYVYTGNESGYTNGHWYYYDVAANAWKDGGIYNAVALQTDTTLTVARMAADAKATGDRFTVDETDIGLNKVRASAYFGTNEVALTLTQGALGYTTGEPVDPIVKTQCYSQRIDYNENIVVAILNVDLLYIGCRPIFYDAQGNYIDVRPSFPAFSYKSYAVKDYAPDGAATVAFNFYSANWTGGNPAMTDNVRTQVANSVAVLNGEYGEFMRYAGITESISSVAGELAQAQNDISALDEEAKGQKNKFLAYFGYSPQEMTLQQGSWSYADGSALARTNHCRTTNYIDISDQTAVVHINRDIRLGSRPVFYDENKVFINAGGLPLVYESAYVLNDIAPENAKYCRLSFYEWNGATMNTANIALVKSNAYVVTTSRSQFEADNETRKTVSALDAGAGDYSGKTIAVIGDSISTNGNPGSGANPNVPEITIQAEDVGVTLSAYLTYYDVQGGLSLGGTTFTSAQIGTEVTFTPVEGDVGKVIGKPANNNPNSMNVWWEQIVTDLGAKVIPVCWSGSSVSSHQKDVTEYKTSYAWHEAQIRKCGIRTPGTMNRTAPDYIIIFRGGNDYSHTPYTILTEDYFKGSSWNYPTDDYNGTNYGFIQAYSITIGKLRKAYPNAKIIISTLSPFKRVNADAFAPNNGINTEPEYNKAIREIADFFGCELIEFDKAGITFENAITQGYTSDGTHPTDKGQLVLANKAMRTLVSLVNGMT